METQTWCAIDRMKEMETQTWCAIGRMKEMETQTWSEIGRMKEKETQTWCAIDGIVGSGGVPPATFWLHEINRIF